MAKKSYNIDLIKSPAFPFGTEYLPAKVEPVSFGGRQRLSDNLKVIDMQNILPTPEGYTSFFGLKGLSMPALPAMTERVFTYRDAQGNNTLIALGKYGLIFTTDGVAWDYSQSTASSSQGYTDLAVGQVRTEIPLKVVYTEPTDNPYTSIRALGANLAYTDILKLMVVGILFPQNIYSRPSVLELPIDPIHARDYVTKYIDIDPATPIVAGDNWYTSSEAGGANYTVVAGDTLNDVFLGLIASNNTYNSGYLSITIVSAGRLKFSALASYSSTSLMFANLYKEPKAFELTNLVATVENRQVPVTIPKDSIGNLGYIKYINTDTLPLDYKGRTLLGTSYNPGFNAGQDRANVTRSGNMNHTAVTGQAGHFLPLSLDEISLRQWSGTKTHTFHIEIYDLGIPLEGKPVGMHENINAVNTGVSKSTLVAGDVFSISTPGQEGIRTLSAADIVAHDNNRHGYVSGLLQAAYNAAGTKLLVQARGDLLYTTTGEWLDVLKCPNASYVRGAAADKYSFIDDTQFYNFLSKAHWDTYLDLQFIDVSGTFLALNPTAKFKFRVDSKTIPIVSPTGLWTDPLTGEFTSAQISAALLAGTKLNVCVAGKVWAIVSDSYAGGGGRLDAQLYSQTIPTAVTAPHYTGPLSGIYWCQSSSTRYLVDGGTKDGRNYNTLFEDTPTLSLNYFNVYENLGVTVGNRTVPTDLTALGYAPSNPSTITKLFSAPAHNNKTVPEISFFFDLPYLLGNISLVNIINSVEVPIYMSAVSVTYTNPETGLANQAVSVGMSALASGNLVYTYSGLEASPEFPIQPSVTRAYWEGLNVVNPWSVAVVKNSLYCYHQTLGHIKHFLPATSLWEQLVPTFVTMAHIQGLCNARGRLLLWDDANAVSTSATLDLMDFVPAIRTRANVISLDALIGDIVVVLPINEGFVVYATASIILAQYTGGTETFKYTTISNVSGILNSKAVVVATETTHYAITGEGLVKVELKGITLISSDFDLYLKSSSVSPRLDFLQGRYLSASFAPAIPSWVNTQVNYFPAVTIAGSPAIPGTIGAIIPGITVPDALIYPKGFTVTVPPINIPAISGVLGAGVIAPDVQLPSLNVVGTLGETVPDRIIAGVTFPEIQPSIPPAIIVPNNAPAVPYLWRLGYTKFVPYVISGYTASYVTTDPAGGPIKTYTYESRNITSPESLIAHYAWHVSQDVYVSSSPGSTVQKAYKDAAGELAFQNAVDANGFTYTALGVGYEYTWRRDRVFVFFGVEFAGQSRYLADGTQTIINAAGYGSYLSAKIWTIISAGSSATSHVIEPNPSFIPSEVDFDETVASRLAAQRVLLQAREIESLFNIVSTNRPVARPLRLYSTNRLQVGLKAPYVAVLTGTLAYQGYPSITYNSTAYGTGPIDNTALNASSGLTDSVPLAPIQGYNTGDNVLLGRVLAQATAPYTIPGLLITKSMRAKGYQIPGYTFDVLAVGAPIVIPGYTIPDYKLPDVPSAPAVPDITIPGGNFVSTIGSRETLDPTYTRSILLDTKLNNWGSFDTDFKVLVDFSPVNARAVNPITQGSSTQYTYQNLAKSIGVLTLGQHLALCTTDNPSATLTIGNIGYSQSGVTRLLEVIAGMVNVSDNSVLEVIGSPDGETISSQLMTSVNTQNGVARLHKVLTGKWFRIRITGKFNLKSLVFSGELGGTR